MSIRARIDALFPRLASEQQFPTQGQTIFVDLERQEVRRAWIPHRVVDALLGGRGVNMFLLHNLLDETLEPIASRGAADFRDGDSDVDGAVGIARQRDLVVAGVARADGLERRRLLPVVHEAERHRSPRALRQSAEVDAAALRRRSAEVRRCRAVRRARQHRPPREDRRTISTASKGRTTASPRSPPPARTSSSAPASWPARKRSTPAAVPARRWARSI